MWAIYKKELKSYFQSVIGWLFLAATLALFGLYFYVYNLVYASPYVSNTLSATTVIMMLAVPILTMRILAEEQKSRTDQLILTSPVSVGKIVLGKYFAVGTIFTAAVAVISVCPLFLQQFGDVPLKECYAAVLGYWLFGMACIAIGTFISALTESQVIAAVLTFAVLFIGYMMTSITQVISSAGNIVTKILNCFNLNEGMDSFYSGTIEVKSVVYYLSLIGLFLFLTVQAIQKRRWSMSTRKLKLGAFSTGLIALSLAAVVAVNLAASQLPDKIASFDVTGQKLYTLTEDTEKILKDLKEDVTVYVLAKEDSQDEILKKTLERYESGSKHITVEYKDPSVSPTFYKEYSDTALSSNSLIVKSEKRSKVIDYNNIYQYETDYNTYQQSVSGYDGEGQLTSAVSYVTSDNASTMYAVTGHGEYSLTGTFQDALSKQNIELNTLNLVEQDSIPEDAECLFLLAPAKDYSQDDVTKIQDYLGKGGRAVIVTNYTTESMEHFYKILDAYQVSVEDGILVENDKEHYYQSPYFLLPQIAYDDVTAEAMDGYIFAPYAQGLNYPKQEEGDGEEGETTSEGITYTALLTTSETAFSKKDVTADDFEKGENDTEGPFTVGLHISKAADGDGTGAQLYVFSSMNLFTDNASQMVYGNNLNLFNGITAQFAGTQQESVIPVKEYQASQLVVTQAAVVTGMVLMIFVIPILLLAAGILIWLKRRKK